MCLCLRCGDVGCVEGSRLVSFGQGLGGWGAVIYVCVVRLDYLCRWQVQVSVYCARRIHAHLSFILLRLIDICLLTSIVCGRYCKSRLTCTWFSDLD